ncbi:MAG: hypothetical protein DYG88_01235 [Chloroflexi bacterium CFX4]|nr:hypothetical protein [Chloroflexi bacterium CFX4]MDL1921478.1 hypothetical protein [Chloroflexi bacterium CFX3]
MQLFIEGAPRTLVPIQAFRIEQKLPNAFGVPFFEPKDFSGLGRLDNSADALHTLRERVLEEVVPNLPPLQWLTLFEHLTWCFETELRAANAVIGLRESEIGFAVSGFADVLNTYAYAVVRAEAENAPRPAFQAVYEQWYMASVRVSSQQHTYVHGSAIWHVQVINAAYGRIGLVVQTDQGRHYVQDASYACPAEGFINRLLSAIVVKLQAVEV